MVFAKGTFEKLSKEEQEKDAQDSWLILSVMERTDSNLFPAIKERREASEDLAYEKDLLCALGNAYPSICQQCKDRRMVVLGADGDYVCSTCGYVDKVPLYVDTRNVGEMSSIPSPVVVQTHPLLQREDLPVALPRHVGYELDGTVRTAYGPRRLEQGMSSISSIHPP